MSIAKEIKGLAIEYGNAVTRHDFKRADEIAKRIFLKNITSTELAGIEPLLRDSDAWVRRWVAQLLLPSNESATNVLSDLARADGLVAVQAILLLDLWSTTFFNADKVSELYPHVDAPAGEGQSKIITDFNSLLLISNTSIRDVLSTHDFEKQQDIGLRTISAIFANE